MIDLISRQAAIDVIDAVFPVDPMKSEYAQGIACGAALAKTYVEQLPSAQQWIPVKWKPLNDREREEWEDFMGYKLADEEAVEPDCKMPDDGDEIWICTKSGQVSEDIFCNDYGLLSLEDEDIMDIVAWMPRTAPEPYKEDANG